MKKSYEDLLNVEDRGDLGEIATPQGSVDKIISDIPEHVFRSSTTTFLDPCMGSGTFIIALIRKLREYGHSMENIEKRIYGGDINLRFYNKVTLKLLRNYNFKNIYHDNSLTRKFDVKFDVILGAPPFSSGETTRNHLKSSRRGQGANVAKAFTQWALSMKPDYLLFLQPYGHRAFSPGVKKEYIKAGLKKVINCSQYYSNIAQTVVYFKFDINSDEEFVDELAIANTLPERSIADHFVNQPGKLSRFEYEDDLLDEGKVKVFVTTSIVKYTNDENFHLKMQDKSYGHWRVVFNCTTERKSIGRVLIASPTDVLSKSVHCLKVESEEQAKRYQKYLKLESTEELLGEVKRSQCNSRKFLQYIPDID